MRDDPAHATLREIAAELESNQIDYAIIGGMALVAHGYLRTTVDVDVLVSPDGLEALHRALEGRGYLPLFADSRDLRNTRTGRACRVPGLRTVSRRWKAQACDISGPGRRGRGHRRCPLR